MRAAVEPSADGVPAERAVGAGDDSGAAREELDGARSTIRRPSERPPPSIICANSERSGAVEKRPACGAMPPRAYAFSSCTSPWTTRRRHVVGSVGAMREELGGGAEVRVGHPERREHARGDEAVERRAGDARGSRPAGWRRGRCRAPSLPARRPAASPRCARRRPPCPRSRDRAAPTSRCPRRAPADGGPWFAPCPCPEKRGR